MENNLVYIDNSIFTKIPHIYLNLNTTITKNLNVNNLTNLYNLNVSNYSEFNKNVNIYSNLNVTNNLNVYGKSLFNNKSNFNNKILLNYSEDSVNTNSGSLIINGGVGIKKNIYIGGNTIIENNLNVLKITNINENLNVLNTTLTKNLNVSNLTNLYNLNVSNYSEFNKNVNINNNLNIYGNTVFNNKSNFNNKVFINYNEESTNSNNGSLIINGGVGIKKNMYIDGNITIKNNLNVLKITNINENLNVLNTTTLNKLNVINNTILKNNLNVENFTVIHKNLNIKANTITEDSHIVYNNIIGHNSLYISKDSSFQSNLTVYGNFAVLGSKFNILSEQTLVADPLVVFGTNQSQTFDNSYGGFVINHSNKFSGLIRYPNTSNFYLHKNIPSNNSNNILNPDLSQLTNSYGNLYLNNINTSNIISNNINITNGIFKNINVNNGIFTDSINITNNLNVSGNINGNLNGTILTNNQPNINNVGILKELNVNSINGSTGKITTKDISVTNNMNVSNDVKISGNLIVTGNSAIVITNHFDINDPIFTITNNLPGYDRGMLLNIGKTNTNDPDLYSGLIRKDNDSNFYLLTNITNPLDKTISTTDKSTLILHNINTSNTSHINGMKFYETINNTNTKNIIAVFPNNNSSKYIEFNKNTQFNKNISVNSNINLNGNLSVNNNFILLDTNTFISHGTTELLGNTTITGSLDIKKSVINCDHVNIRSFFNNLGTTRTKTLDVDNVKVIDKLRFPIRTISDIQDYPINKTGYVIYNKDKNLYEGHNGTTWIPLGIDPTSQVDTVINSNLNVTLNLNLGSNAIVQKDLIIFGNTTCNQHLTVNKGLIIPHNTIDIPSKPGSIYYNSNGGLFYGYSNQWLPLGGINPYTDTIINHNLNVNKNVIINKNLNIKSNLNVNNNVIINENLNVNKNLIINENLNVNYNITTKTITSNNTTILDNLKVPNHNNSSTTLNSTSGSIYFNTSSNLFYGHNNSSWLPLGGINPYTDTTIDHNLNVNKNLIINENVNVNYNITTNTITSNNNTILYNLKVPNHNNSSTKLNSTSGSIYFNTSSNLFYGHNNSSWLPLGGINPYTDTTIDHNLNVNKNIKVHNKITTNTLNVKGLSNFEGLVYVNNKLTSKQLIIPALTTNIDTTNNIDTGSLYINYNGPHSQLKLRLNNQDNIIPFNNNPIIQLTSSTDIFQFYNVQKNQPIYGNRITGLNDPAFNSFTKFYTLQEYTFFQETLLTDIEFYVSHSINNPNPTDLVFNLDIIRTRSSNTTNVFNDQFTVPVATVSFETFTNFVNNKFLKNDKIKLKLTLTNDYNGHEIFIRLHGHAKIHPNVDKLHILDTTDIPSSTTNVPALLVEGGGEFKKSIKATNVSNFTGSHEATLISTLIYDNNYSYYHNNKYIFKTGLIVSVNDSTYININNSKFNIILTNKRADTTVFGVIQSYVNNNIYTINSLGEGAIWISNINGNVNNGDYIMTSDIKGYGCKQNDDILHSYTVAKCCSVINWNSINSYISHYNTNYKIAFVACTYHCG